MMAKLGLVVVVLAVLVLQGVRAKKEMNFKTCKRTLPQDKLNECLKEALSIAFPQLAGGIPEYGILPIDPLRVEKMVLPRSKGSAVSVDMTFINLDIIGISRLAIKKVEASVKDLSLKIYGAVPGVLKLLGTYKIDGKVLVLPISGSGYCNVTEVNLNVIVDVKLKTATIKGKEFASVTQFKMTATSVDRVYYQLDNLFNGNKELGDNMNLVLNDNWKEVFDDMVAPVLTAGGLALGSVVQQMLTKVPFEKIFPSS